MIVDNNNNIKRSLNQQNLHADLVIVGGGLGGTCTAITAARAGLKVILVQDRPVLGGNASSEVRLWVLGDFFFLFAPTRYTFTLIIFCQTFKGRFNSNDGIYTYIPSETAIYHAKIQKITANIVIVLQLQASINKL